MGVDLQWIDRRGKHYDDQPFNRQYLVDRHTDRIHGFVDHPVKDDLSFTAIPHGMTDRYYLTQEAARGYRTECAIRQIAEECKAFDAEAAEKTAAAPEMQAVVE